MRAVSRPNASATRDHPARRIRPGDRQRIAALCERGIRALAREFYHGKRRFRVVMDVSGNILDTPQRE